MGEITVDNFNELYPEIEQSINNAAFIAIDTEFSSLCISDKFKPSLFDTPIDRYRKLRENISQIIPVQIGVTTFEFDPDKYIYMGKSYVFYVCPRALLNIDCSFVFQASSLRFLNQYNFDFNKFVNKGIPFLNNVQQSDLQDQLQLDFILDDLELEHFLQPLCDEVSKWSQTCNNGDFLVLNSIDVLKLSKEQLYPMHKTIRDKGLNKIYTYIENNKFVVKKVTSDEFNELNIDLEDDIYNYLLGFTRIHKLLINAKKPLIGHNCLIDLMLMYNSFETPLPKSYTKFKRELNELFPIIFDTKSISHNLRSKLPLKKEWSDASLKGLYTYFKEGSGRHLAISSPLIDSETETPIQFHNAGFDSFCTGYIFIRMSHIYATSKYESITSRKIGCNELLNAVAPFQNTVNVIRGSAAYIKLDGDDPETKRPPLLVVTSNKNAPVNIKLVNEVLFASLDGRGYLEVKPSSSSKNIALVAVDNKFSYKEILLKSKNNSFFQIRQYSVFRHSPIMRAMIWSTLVASGTFLAVVAHSTLRK